MAESRRGCSKIANILKNIILLYLFGGLLKNSHILGNIFICAAAFQLRSILRMKLKDQNIDVSIEEAMRSLDRLRAVQIIVKSEKEIQVQRKLTQIDSEIRMLIEVFNMGDCNKLPDVNV